MGKFNYLKPILLSLGILVPAIATAYDFEADGIYYDITSETTVAVSSGDYSGDIVIPNEVTHEGNTYIVTAIGDLAFHQSGITSIVISDSIRSIGYYSFRKCTGLRSVTVGESVPSLICNKGGRKFYAFDGCDSITSLTWNAVNCPDMGHMGTTCIEQVTIGPKVQLIPKGFVSGSAITAVTIPNTVTAIDDWAFEGCKSLSSIAIPNSVTTIGQRVFAGCTSLETASIGNGIAAITSSTFQDCALLRDVVIPNSVTVIDDYAFAGCTGLTSIDIPASVTTLGNGAFGGCTGLTSVSIPNSVTSIGHVRGNDETMDSSNYGTFAGCTGLTSIVIPNTVATIHEGMCYGCTSLAGITIPSSVTYISNEAFAGCSSLTDLTIPNSVLYIDKGAFRNCSGLSSIAVQDGNPAYDSRGNCNAIIKTVTNELIMGCQNTVIPETVTSIAPFAFDGCRHLTSIFIPKTVTSIGRYYAQPDDNTTYEQYNPFAGCDAVVSIVVEDGNPVYDSRDNCNAVIESATSTLAMGCTSTIIPSTVSTIGDYAFQSNNALTSIDIPNTVIAIGEGAFSSCTGLTTVSLGDSLTTIGAGAFMRCCALSSVDFPNSLTTIDTYAFRECTALTSVTIPNGVHIEGYEQLGQFWGCTSLTSVTIGSGVTDMTVMFWECPNITSVTCLATTPPHCWALPIYLPEKSSFNFNPEVLEQATLHVPAAALEAYQTASYWNRFQHIEPMPWLPGDVNGDNEVSIADVNSVIDLILSAGYTMVGDVNGDGEVSIADINATIDLILSSN